MATQTAKPGRPGSKTYATCTFSTETTGLSDVINTNGLALHSVHLTSSWTAAGITFMASANSTDTMGSVRHTTASLEYKISSATTGGMVVSVDPYLFNSYRFLQLRSGSTASPVTQATTRVATLGFNSLA